MVIIIGNFLISRTFKILYIIEVLNFVTNSEPKSSITKRLDPKISKSAYVSVNKYKKKKLFINNNNKNNKYNYIRISPLNNKKVESPFNQRLIANKFKGSKIMNTSFKKVTSFKNVKESNDNSMLNRTDDGDILNNLKKK